MSEIIKVYALAEMFPAGQKTDAAVVEYDVPVSNSALSAERFSVEGRSVTGAYANDKPERTENGRDGRFVILELDCGGKAGDVVISPEKKNPGPPPPKYRVVPQVSVKQTADIAAADGSGIPVSADYVSSSATIEPTVEDFVISEYNGLKYNLFVPKDMQAGEKYPLVLFIGDMGANGLDDRMALSQGIGGTVWATEAEQAKRKCFVLVPQFPAKQIMRDDFTFDPMFDLVKPLLDKVCAEYPVDMSRIYGTGQSQGCMATCELICEYPDLYAGCMLVAGQWSPERMEKAWNGLPLWVLISEVDEKAPPVMNEIAERLEGKGAKVGRFFWNAKEPKAQLEGEAKAAAAAPADIRFTVFTGDSVIPDDDNGPFRLRHAHGCTWPVAYNIEGVRDWLFTCRKA